MRALASGVTVITSFDASARPAGMTATAFTSVSIDPPRVLVCANSDSRTAAAIAAHRAFAVNLLAVGDLELAQRFSSRADDKFAGVDWETRDPGVPALNSALAVVTCRVEQAIETGTHVIYLGEVVTTSHREGAPLIYLDGAYRSVTDLS